MSDDKWGLEYEFLGGAPAIVLFLFWAIFLGGGTYWVLENCRDADLVYDYVNENVMQMYAWSFVVIPILLIAIIWRRFFLQLFRVVNNAAELDSVGMQESDLQMNSNRSDQNGETVSNPGSEAGRQMSMQDQYYAMKIKDDKNQVRGCCGCMVLVAAVPLVIFVLIVLLFWNELGAFTEWSRTGSY